MAKVDHSKSPEKKIVSKLTQIFESKPKKMPRKRKVISNFKKKDFKMINRQVSNGKTPMSHRNDPVTVSQEQMGVAKLRNSSMDEFLHNESTEGAKCGVFSMTERKAEKKERSKATR